MLALAVAGARQAGPDIPALIDSGFDSSRDYIGKRPALSDVLNGEFVLADRPEVWELQKIAVVRPIPEHLLVAARGIGGQPATVDLLGLPTAREGMGWVAIEQLKLAIDPGHDDVVTIVRAFQVVAAQLGPGDHVEECEQVTANALLFCNSWHGQTPGAKKPAISRRAL